MSNLTNPNHSINTIYRPNIWTIDYAFRTVVLELRLLTLDPDPIIKLWGTNSTDFCDMFANSNQLSNYIKQISISTSDTLYDIYYRDFLTSHSLNNKKLLSDAKENRKKRLYQTMIDIIANHPSARISKEDIDEKFIDPEFINMIDEGVEDDFKLYKSHEKKQNQAKKVDENENDNNNSYINNEIKERKVQKVIDQLELNEDVKDKVTDLIEKFGIPNDEISMFILILELDLIKSQSYENMSFRIVPINKKKKRENFQKLRIPVVDSSTKSSSQETEPDDFFI